MTNKKKITRLKIFNLVLLSFVLIFIANVLIMGDMMNPFVSILSGDISAAQSLDFAGFMKIFLLLSGETGVMSVVFVQVTKRVFR